MGVLHWTEDQALNALMSSIRAALKGHNRYVGNLLKSVLGPPMQTSAGKQAAGAQPTPSAQPATPENVQRFFKLMAGRKGAKKNGRKSRS